MHRQEIWTEDCKKPFEKKWWEIAPFSRVAYSFGKASIGSIIDAGSKQSAKSNFSLVN